MTVAPTSRPSRSAATGSLPTATEVAIALGIAESAYAADADHLARYVLTGLILRGAVTQAEVHEAIERGLTRFRANLALARDPGARA